MVQNWEMGFGAVLLAMCAITGAIAARRLLRRIETKDERPRAAAATPTPRDPIPSAAAEPAGGSQPRNCPVCLSEYRGQVRFCAVDGAELRDGPGRSDLAHGMICPTCRRGYPADAAFCPEDLDDLIPYGLYGASTRRQTPQRLVAGKICPECGDRYATAQAFCGRDGSLLVVVN